MTETASIDQHTQRLPAASARQRILAQHTELRRLLAMSVVQSMGIVQDHPAQHESLRSLVTFIRAVFVQHLAEEEAVILPILDDDLPLGPARAELLRTEHASQRAQLDGLCAWPEDGDEEELARRFDGLARQLLRDIAHEERELLVPDVLRDDHIVIDQCGG